jgi:hypothetical protein
MTQAAILRCRRAVFLGGDLVLPIYVKWPRTFRDTKKDCAKPGCRNDDRLSTLRVMYFRLWHQTDMPRWSLYVRCWEQSGPC